MKLLPTLTLIFVVFKMLGYIDWSWWLVFSPVFVGLAVSVVFYALAGSLLLFAKSRYAV